VIHDKIALPYPSLCLLRRYGYELVRGKGEGAEAGLTLGKGTRKYRPDSSETMLSIPGLSPTALIHALDDLEAGDRLHPIFVLSNDRDGALIRRIVDHGCSDFLMMEDDPEGWLQ
jgi:DNA-binding NarL/FixJ family response regulator